MAFFIKQLSHRYLISLLVALIISFNKFRLKLEIILQCEIKRDFIKLRESLNLRSYMQYRDVCIFRVLIVNYSRICREEDIALNPVVYNLKAEVQNKIADTANQ
jgi:hypothetical protein